LYFSSEIAYQALLRSARHFGNSTLGLPRFLADTNF
jgi:hypothetical protein